MISSSKNASDDRVDKKKRTLLEGTVVQSDMRGDTCTALLPYISHTHPPCPQQFLEVTLPPPKALFSFKTKKGILD